MFSTKMSFTYKGRGGEEERYTAYFLAYFYIPTLFYKHVIGQPSKQSWLLILYIHIYNAQHQLNG